MCFQQYLKLKGAACDTGMSQPSLNWQRDVFAWASEPSTINDLWASASQPKLSDIPMPRLKKRPPPDKNFRIPKAREVPWPPMAAFLKNIFSKSMTCLSRGSL